MLRLELELNELDYSALADGLLPYRAEELKRQGKLMAGLLSACPEMAKKLLSRLSQGQLDSLAAQAINRNASAMARRGEELAAELGVATRIISVRATAW
jgi:hypothetical protein